MKPITIDILKKEVSIPSWYDEDIHRKIVFMVDHSQQLQACKFLCDLSKEKDTRNVFDLRWSKALTDVIKTSANRFLSYHEAMRRKKDLKFQIIEGLKAFVNTFETNMVEGFQVEVGELGTIAVGIGVDRDRLQVLYKNAAGKPFSLYDKENHMSDLLEIWGVINEKSPKK